MVGCSRETVGRIIKMLEDQNLIHAHGKNHCGLRHSIVKITSLIRRLFCFCYIDVIVEMPLLIFIRKTKKYFF